MKIKQLIFYISTILTVISCSESNENKSVLGSQKFVEENNLYQYIIDTVTELTDEQYPNNPDISIRSKKDGMFSHQNINITRKNNDFTVTFLPANKNSDTVIIPNINLLEWIPTAPNWIKKDKYLTHIGIINQEWNRMQVNFTEEQYIIKGNNEESKTITRVDLARNCINAYLWEAIFYTQENGKRKPCYHGWFNFPKDFYASLFEEKNKLIYNDFSPSLEQWIDPPSEHVNLDLLRTVESKNELTFTNQNNEFYPVQGERKKKAINIMVPKKRAIIQDFLTDSTLYATFSSPGFYNQQEPRTTQLSKLNKLIKVSKKETISINTAGTKTFELQFVFQNKKDTTQLIIGGLQKENIPSLSPKGVNKGYQMPMGIANHSFYTNYSGIKNNPTSESPYFAFLLDQNNNWLDSHTIGIDGPLLHFDKENPNLLHIWILSFERHSFVGHYIVNIENLI